MIFAGFLGRPRGGGFRPRPHPRPRPRRWRPRYYAAPGYYYPDTVMVAAEPMCATAPMPPPVCPSGTLVWRGPNTVCCIP
jgi:hypothetical protein